MATLQHPQLKFSIKITLMLIAFLFSLAIIFVILFRVNTPQTANSETDENNSNFIMIPDIESENPQTLSRINEDHLNLPEQNAIDNFDDPTIINFPNSKHGFSPAKNELLQEPPPPQIKEYSFPLENVTLAENRRLPLIENFASNHAANTSANLINLPKLGEIIVINPNPPANESVIWLENGRQINSKPPISKELIKNAAKNQYPGSPTEITITNLNSSPMYFINKSSGVPELDKLATDYVKNLLLQIYSGKIPKKNLPESLLIDWRPALKATNN